MRQLLACFALVLALVSCNREKAAIPKEYKISGREAALPIPDSLEHGKTYLPIYSHIYHVHERRTYDLTVTVSIRNVSPADTVFILRGDYYNTKGDKIREYIKAPIYVLPMETVEIVIAEADREGGSGANFVFDWAAQDKKNPPLIEAVMISTYGEQGVSFSSRGVRIYE
ncbi:DUF3124 domain-containing protein [Maribellus sp. YY47]|uniref:DUF3124 domain-containing protein n=1 Tax=Maribellus sp. YY47 TaxID=2929486 RepID=UPI0020010DB9|nr:DUF3124 domain-containing protein [Maribellus sp. YY47]MCK3685753.1 DUF3124 domain-containing protein [Maribellus sp. YY47]